MSLLSILNVLIRATSRNPLVIVTVPIIILTTGCSGLKISSQPAVNSKTAIAASVIPNQEKVDKNQTLNQEKSSEQIIAKGQTCIQGNPLDESTKFALQAANLAQTAKSQSEWDEV
ncbi:MAG: hypothetical protein ACKPGD_20415, partial [Planktothrix sp.]